MIELSIVTPAHNEDGNIDRLCEELTSICEELCITYEIVIVDDASTDATWEKINSNASASNAIKGIRLPINFGQTKALEIGIINSKGSFVLTIDSDLQHPVRLIPEFWKNRNTTGIVAGRQVSRNDGKLKSILSKVYYVLLRFVSGIDIVRDVGDFRLIRRDILNILIATKEEKVLRFLIPKYGFKTVVIDFNADNRNSGKTKYSVTKMLKFAAFSLTSTTTRPLYLSVYLSMIFAGLTFVDFLYVLVIHVSVGTVPGWASLLGLISGAFTVLFGILGIFGIYLAHLLALNTISKPIIEHTDAWK
jgi:glycosyltransferase involved in cell wall biosynthesis